MFTIAEKLKTLRNELGLSQTEVAEHINITKPTYASYEKGKDISVGTLMKLADFFNVSFEYFFSEENEDNVSEAVRIPIYSKASAGNGIYAQEEPLDWLELPKSIAKNANFGSFIEGDSMEPKIFGDDLILIRSTDILEDGDIGVFYLNENIYCKKFKYNPLKNEITLKSLNSKYDPIKIEIEDDFHIIGKVVGVLDYTI